MVTTCCNQMLQLGNLHSLVRHKIKCTAQMLEMSKLEMSQDCWAINSTGGLFCWELCHKPYGFLVTFCISSQRRSVSTASVSITGTNDSHRLWILSEYGKQGSIHVYKFQQNTCFLADFDQQNA